MSLVVMVTQSDYGSARRMDQWMHRFFPPAPAAKKLIHPAMDASGVKRRPEAVKFFFQQKKNPQPTSHGRVPFPDSGCLSTYFVFLFSFTPLVSQYVYWMLRMQRGKNLINMKKS